MIRTHHSARPPPLMQRFEEQPFLSREQDAFSTGRIFSSQSRRQWLSARPSLSFLAAVVISALIGSIATLTFQNFYAPNTSQSASNVVYPYPNLKLPSLGDIEAVFEENSIFLDRSNHEEQAQSEEAWKSLIPNGRGFVSTAKLQAAGVLPQSLLDTDTEHAGQFAVASFHQLHCLHMIVGSYTKALKDVAHDIQHTKHCLEYLRSSIMCAADSTLEPWKNTLNGVDGFGNPHMCRDFDELFRWAEEYRHIDV